MKREDILAMEPGRELDVLVAEKVMGWSRSGGAWKQKNGRTRTLEPTSFGSFEPSADISAAWEVMEMFKENFLLNWLDRFHLFPEDGWHCNINGYHAHGCKTAPEAICKAALIAIIEQEGA